MIRPPEKNVFLMIADTELSIVNPHLKFPRVSLTEPSGSHYLLMAAEVDTSIIPFFIRASAEKKKLLAMCKEKCRLLEERQEVINATVFKARLIPPGQGKFVEKRKGKVHVAKFDVVVLIEVSDRKAAEVVRDDNLYQEILQLMEKAAKQTYFNMASNVKHIGPVNHQKQGVFLFNYFFADDLDQNLGVWEYTAGWFQQETGLDNSTVMLPLEEEKHHYTIINHCRWDSLSDILPSLIFKKSFHSYVLDNFYANNVAAIPVLYKIA